MKDAADPFDVRLMVARNCQMAFPGSLRATWQNSSTSAIIKNITSPR